MTELRDVEIDGKKIAFHDGTRFHVQVGGPNRYAKYKTKYTIVGNPVQAVLYYRGINLGPGFRARLVMEGGAPRPIIAKKTGGW